MKKIFTLALSLFILSSAFSQTYVSRVSFKTPFISFNFGHRYVETYSFTQFERNRQIENINANYNQQVKEVMSLRIGAAKKIDLIQQLQKGKAGKVQNVNDRYFDAKNKYNYMHYDRNYRWIK